MANSASSDLRPSPLQNRVTPFGEIIATPERGMFMGNRGGCLHDAEQRLTPRRWTNTHWITCLLEFKGWHREVMMPRRYTELFFLDEATALAAGHRPCFECRRADALRFFECWRTANVTGPAGSRPAVAIVDRVLHRERVTRSRAKVNYRATTGELPGGTFVARGEAPFLVWRDRLWRWSPAGYSDPETLRLDGEVTVLTPRSTVAALAAGYVPAVHASLIS